MADVSLLSNLCAICHTRPRKYTCPRCGLQSCSLPCVKRHKLRSQCSGIRDPARYHKRGELATPHRLDQDFNFITGIERSLERAERTILHRGIPTADDERLYKGEAKLRAEIEKRGVLIRRAPNGMSRNRLNATRWHKRHKRLFWTVEWVLPDNRHITNTSETELIRDSYAKLPRDGSQALAVEASRESQGTCDGGRNESGTRSDKNVPEDTISKQVVRQHGSDGAVSMFFYLHRPVAPSKTPALISLSSDSTLATAIQGQALLEFPTIYVLPHAPDDLPANYVSWTESSESQLHENDVQQSCESF